MSCKGMKQGDSEMMCKDHCDKSISECSKKNENCYKGDVMVEQVIVKEVK